MSIDAALRQIAEAQFGLVRRDQARAVGLTPSTLRRLLARGWVRENAHPLRVERALDTMWARRLVDAAQLADVVADLAQRGRKGSTLMRELLAARDIEYRAPESRLERRFMSIIDGAGDEAFERQVQLGDDRGPIGRVDFLDRRRRLVVETDSDRYHSSPSDRAADARRDARLSRAGFEVLRIDEATLATPPVVLLHVRSARAGHDLARVI